MSPSSRSISALSALRSTAGDTRSFGGGLAIFTCATAAVTSISGSSAKNESKKDQTSKLEVYLMDRIAKKPYLNNPSVVHRSHESRYHSSSDEVDSTMGSRPKGVPTRLRILAIDVPNCKTHAFRDGMCQHPSKIFEGVIDPVFKDGVARPKRMDQAASNETRSRKDRRESRRPIEQKSLATSLYYCYGKSNTKIAKNKEIDPVIGVEILEASIMNLNPNNIRRTYTSKSAYKYDPGKYSSKKHDESDGSFEKERLQRHETDSGIADVEETTEELHEEAAAAIEDNNNIKGRDETEDTRTAPWNQYAWLEEIHLRVSCYCLD